MQNTNFFAQVNAIIACGYLVRGFDQKPWVDDDFHVKNALATMYGRFGDIDCNVGV